MPPPRARSRISSSPSPSASSSASASASASSSSSAAAAAGAADSGKDSSNASMAKPDATKPLPICPGIPSSIQCSSRILLVKFLCPLLALLILVVYSACRSSGSNQVSSDSLKKSYGFYTYKIINEYDHDPRAFTQGLVYGGNDTFYESTGLYGLSSLRKVYGPSGEVLKQYNLNSEYFGEGLALFNHRLIQVAWKITYGFIYDERTFSLLGKFQHPMKDGWGLATDGKVLYGSDGSSTIYMMDPSTFKEERKYVVKDEKKEVTRLNELEYIHGELWANVWLTDCIVRVSPKDGHVLGWVLLHELRSNLLAAGNNFIDVLNGIAWDSEKDRIFVTGKDWPKLYEIKVFRDEKLKLSREDVWKRCHV